MTIGAYEDAARERDALVVTEIPGIRTIQLQRSGYTGFLSLVWLLFKEWRWANKRRMKVKFGEVIAGGKWL